MDHMGDEQRYRVVLFGAGRVGKSAIISQFLTNEFKEKYKETVEDLHCREYNVNGNCIKVDILDTSGTMQFPAMRRLSISTAHAFLLVYSINSRESFKEVEAIYEQIREQRENFDEIPVVIVGNKKDLDLDREVDYQDVEDTIVSHNWHCAFLEASAKENSNILDIFQKLLELAKIPAARQLSPVLKRRMSERVTSKRRKTGDSLHTFKESEKEMSRSRSLIRRVGRPKVKHADPTKNDCVIC